MKDLIKNFNSENSLLVITSFPYKSNLSGISKGFNAVSWHSNKTLSQLSQAKKIIVCAEDIRPRKINALNKNLVVVGAWKKSKIFSFISLLSFILKQDKVSQILVQFEFNVFGGTIPNLCLISLLFVLKLLGKNITFELHQVIKDVGALEKHVNIKNYFVKKFLNFGLLFYYIAIGIVSKNVIVFEQELKDRLKNLISLNKIHILPLSVDRKVDVSREKAKQELKISKNKFTLLVFGFINGYKGIDWILKMSPLLKKQSVSIIVAGGKNPYLKDKSYYKHFYASIIKEAKKHSNVSLAGFVPDDQIQTYFAGADLVVMPYEVFMSASGPFSLAIEHRRPLILSNVLKNYQKTDDFKRAMNISGLKTNELFFKFNKYSLPYLVDKAMKNKTYYTKLGKFSETLAELRSINYSILKLHSMVSNKEKVRIYVTNKDFNVQI